MSGENGVPAVGSAADIVGRMRGVLPDRWFADRAPVLDGLLAGFASAWAPLHALLATVRRQSRLGTASDEFLDLWSRDLFGARLPRESGETDGAFRARIRRRMARSRATRAAVLDALADADAVALRVFEPSRPADTGAYGAPGLASGLAWGVAGGWGSLAMPGEVLVTARGNGDAVAAALADAMPAGGAAWVRMA